MRFKKSISFLVVFFIALGPSALAQSLSFENILSSDSILLPCERGKDAQLLEKYLGNSSAMSESHKIQYLLSRIKTSDATFVRNGRHYSGKQAAKFLRWKMRHRQYRKEPIRTAEDFVNRVVVRSEKSGLPYQILFPNGDKEKANRILRNELEALERMIASQSPAQRLSAGLAAADVANKDLPSIGAIVAPPSNAA